MSSTLPRSRSLSSGANSVSSPSLAIDAKDRVRPVSLCESSWGRVVLPGPAQKARALQRSPSQANNLATTVPCSLVNKSLGGRHHPTRSSLRHSRMVVLNKTLRGTVSRRWTTSSSPSSSGLGRVGALVITAQTVVGLLMGAVAAWCVLWAPRSVPFREVPHYAAIPLFVSGLLGTMLLTCCSDARRRSPANFLKGLIVMSSGIAIVTCLCVCIFTALHLVYLAPMKCRPQRDIVTQLPEVFASGGPRLVGDDASDLEPPELYSAITPYSAADDAPPTIEGNYSNYNGTDTTRKNKQHSQFEGGEDGSGDYISLYPESIEPTEIFNDSTDFSAHDLDNKRIEGTEQSLTDDSAGIDIDGSTAASTRVMGSDANLLDPIIESSGLGPGSDVEYLPKLRRKIKRNDPHADDEDDVLPGTQEDGSGYGGNAPLLEQERLIPVAPVVLSPGYEMPIHVEIIYCICESFNGHWKRTFRYLDLTCREVNRVLPVLSVATCIVTAGGAVLSGVVLYLLWASKDTFYEPVRPAEIRPFLFSNHLQRNGSFQSKVNGVPVWNGDGAGSRNGHARYNIS